jgi:hypothetical protein
MISETDDTRLGRLEGRMDLMVQAIQDLRESIQDLRIQDVRQELHQEVRAVNGRIDRLTLAVLGMGGGVIVALVSLVGVLAVQLIRSG